MKNIYCTKREKLLLIFIALELSESSFSFHFPRLCSVLCKSSPRQAEQVGMIMLHEFKV